jgi:hypothetical protein
MPGLNNQSKPAFDRQHKVALLKKIAAGNTITDTDLLDPDYLGTWFVNEGSHYYGSAGSTTYMLTKEQFQQIEDSAKRKGVELTIWKLGALKNNWFLRYTKPFQAS